MLPIVKIEKGVQERVEFFQLQRFPIEERLQTGNGTVGCNQDK